MKYLSQRTALIITHAVRYVIASTTSAATYTRKVDRRVHLSRRGHTFPRAKVIMGTTEQLSLANALPETAAAEPKQRTFGVPQLIAAMLKSGGHISDLIFSPGRAPQVEVSGQLVELKFKGLECLKPEDTAAIAYELMGKNEHPIRKAGAGRLCRSCLTESTALAVFASIFFGSAERARS